MEGETSPLPQCSPEEMLIPSQYSMRQIDRPAEESANTEEVPSVVTAALPTSGGQTISKSTKQPTKGRTPAWFRK